MVTKEKIVKMFDYKDGHLYRKNGKKAGTLRKNGYWQTGIEGKIYFNHRLIFLMHYGYMPKFVDHIDGNPSNNKIENLREATLIENQQNRKICNKNTSGIKGVYFHKRTKKWMVKFWINKKLTYFGEYFDKEVAKFVAETMRYKYHNQFARSV